MYFIVTGCSTVFNSFEEANRKALEIANQKLSNNLLTKTTKTVEVVDYDTDDTDETQVRFSLRIHL
jgi:archaellum component FlaF (FlaF/FlaG flagellin family)